MLAVPVILGVVAAVTVATPPPGHIPQLIDDKNPPKYEYGYVVSDKEGSTQGHVESRDGIYALGRYYVTLPDGSEQKVTYFADDWGYHPLVTYTSSTASGHSRTEFAMGDKAVAALKSTALPSPAPTTPVKVVTTGTPAQQHLILVGPAASPGVQVASAGASGHSEPQLEVQGASFLPAKQALSPIHVASAPLVQGATLVTPSEHGVGAVSFNYQTASSAAFGHQGVEVTTPAPLVTSASPALVVATTPAPPPPQYSATLPPPPSVVELLSGQLHSVPAAPPTLVPATPVGDISSSAGQGIQQHSIGTHSTVQPLLLPPSPVSYVIPHANSVILQDGVQGQHQVQQISALKNILLQASDSRLSTSGAISNSVLNHNVPQAAHVSHADDVNQVDQVVQIVTPEPFVPELDSNSIAGNPLSSNNTDTTVLSHGGQNIKITSYLADTNRVLFYGDRIGTKQREEESELRLLDEIQEHARQHILSDLHREHVSVGVSTENVAVGPAVTLRPIVVASASPGPSVPTVLPTKAALHSGSIVSFNGETGFNSIVRSKETSGHFTTVSTTLQPPTGPQVLPTAPLVVSEKSDYFEQIRPGDHSVLITPRPSVLFTIDEEVPNQASVSLLSVPEPTFVGPTQVTQTKSDPSYDVHQPETQPPLDVAPHEVSPTPQQYQALGYEQRLVNSDAQQVVQEPDPVVRQNKQGDLQLKQELELQQVQQSLHDLQQKIVNEIDAQHEEEQRKQEQVNAESARHFETSHKLGQSQILQSGAAGYTASSIVPEAGPTGVDKAVQQHPEPLSSVQPAVVYAQSQPAETPNHGPGQPNYVIHSTAQTYGEHYSHDVHDTQDTHAQYQQQVLPTPQPYGGQVNAAGPTLQPLLASTVQSVREHYSEENNDAQAEYQQQILQQPYGGQVSAAGPTLQPLLASTVQSVREHYSEENKNAHAQYQERVLPTPQPYVAQVGVAGPSAHPVVETVQSYGTHYTSQNVEQTEDKAARIEEHNIVPGAPLYHVSGPDLQSLVSTAQSYSVSQQNAPIEVQYTVEPQNQFFVQLHETQQLIPPPPPPSIVPVEIEKPVIVEKPVAVETTKVVEIEKPIIVKEVVPVENTKIVEVEKPVAILHPYPVEVTKVVHVDRPIAVPTPYTIAQPIPIPFAVPHAVEVPIPHLIPYPEVISYEPLLVTRGPYTGGMKPSHQLPPQIFKEAAKEMYEHSHGYHTIPIHLKYAPTHKGQHTATRVEYPRGYNHKKYHIHSGRSRNALKNLRIEYGGFKPPLIPSAEIREEPKPSAYGPSVRPE